MATQGISQLTQPVSERDHTRGPHSAEVSLVEYGDFECPYCRAAEPIVAGLIEALGAQLSVTFRHFPLSQVHSHAGARRRSGRGRSFSRQVLGNARHPLRETGCPR